MNPKPYQRKASKGTVQIKNSNDRLQLVFTFAGDRHYISLGFADNPQNRKLAEMKANGIELDILSGHFDQSLEKYKPQPTLDRAAPDSSTPKVPTLMEVWKAYVEDRAGSVKETTKGYHASFTRLFKRIGDVPLLDSQKVKQVLQKETTMPQTKRALRKLRTACEFAKEQGWLDVNPYVGVAKKMPKYRYELEPQPNAFTQQQQEQVIEAFKNHKGNWNGRSYAGRGYAHYAPLVEFWLRIGCRPSEGIGLRWGNVAPDCSSIHFTGSITTSGNGIPTRVEGSKNNKKRIVPCSERLQALLQSIRPDSPDPEALVFPSPKGKAINYNNFRNNAWKRVVNPIKPDTTPYSCRDTFITMQVLKGIPESVIAKWCDTSVEVLQKNYIDFLKLSHFKPFD